MREADVAIIGAGTVGMGGSIARRANKPTAPDYALGSHVAPLRLTFATDGGFGERFSQGALIGEYGSWNFEDFAGYKVVWVPCIGGRPSGQPVDFATAFLTDDGNARGRPVGVFFDPGRRILLVADDM